MIFTKDIKRNPGVANTLGFIFMANSQHITVHFHIRKTVAIFTLFFQHDNRAFLGLYPNEIERMKTKITAKKMWEAVEKKAKLSACVAKKGGKKS